MSTPTSKRSVLLESLAMLLIGTALMHFVHTGTWGIADKDPGISGHDSYYHAKMAAMIPEHGVLKTFPWLRFCYFTADDDGFVSNHYGYHVLLSPFVHASKWITGEYLPGGRWATSVFFGVNLLLFNLLLRSERVPWRWVWLILLMLLPFQFFTRHAFIRAIGPSLACMLLLLLFLFRRRHVLAGLTVGLSIHVYLGGVVYGPVIVVLYVIARLLAPDERFSIPWRTIAWTFGGWVIGIVVHPYAADLPNFLAVQIFGSGLSPDIPVGREWKSYEGLWWFAQMTGPLLTTWAIAVCIRLRSGQRISANVLTLLLLNFVMFALTCKARRFIEYWPMFCLLSAAFLCAPFLRELAGWVDGKGRAPRPRIFGWCKRGAGVACVMSVFAIAQFAPNWSSLRSRHKSGYDLEPVRKAMAFLQENSQAGDVVFTDDWDIFPLYFYYNSHNNYIVGLDPKWTHARNPEIWERFATISRGQAPKTVTVKVKGEDGESAERKIKVRNEDIRDVFGAKYVVTDHDHLNFAKKLNRNKKLIELIYPCTSFNECKEEPYLIFRVLADEGGDQG